MPDLKKVPYLDSLLLPTGLFLMTLGAVSIFFDSALGQRLFTTAAIAIILARIAKIELMISEIECTKSIIDGDSNDPKKNTRLNG